MSYDQLVPLIEISALPQPSGARERVMDALVGEVSSALGRPPNAVWVTWRQIEPGAYSVGGTRAEAQPRDSHPPIVRIYARRTPEEWELIVVAVERVITRELGLDPFLIVEKAEL